MNLTTKTAKTNQVFYVSLVIIFAIMVWGLFSPSSFENTANNLFNFLVGKFGWFYLLSMASFVVFSIWIAFSKYGKIKLGKDDDKPEYGNISWFAMLFSAGMGVGLVFWGVAEPLNHFVNPLGVEGGTAAAAEFAVRRHLSFIGDFIHGPTMQYPCSSTGVFSV